MSAPSVLVSFRLDRDQPARVRWLATDGVPGDGYKAQVIAILLADGTRLPMHGSSILEHTAPDPGGGIGGYLLAFSGVVGYAADDPDRARIEQLLDEEVGYDLEFVREDGRVAELDRDYKIVDRPRAMARKISHRDA